MDNKELELRDYIEVLLRQKWIIILVFWLFSNFSSYPQKFYN